MLGGKSLLSFLGNFLHNKINKIFDAKLFFYDFEDLYD